jgi:hypothetical protein
MAIKPIAKIINQFCDNIYTIVQNALALMLTRKAHRFFKKSKNITTTPFTKDLRYHKG